MAVFIKLLNRETRKIILLLLLAVFILSGAGAQQVSITVKDAVQFALTTDTSIKSAVMDIETSRARVKEAKRNLYPSLSLSGGYTRLSHVTSAISLGPASTDIESQDDNFSLSANFQYPVFAGFRLREAVKLAELQVRGKEVSTAITRNAVVFETRRAYWEAVRASYNVNMLKKNLALMNKNRDVMKQRLSQGTVLQADLLSTDMRSDQAEMDLGNAVLFQKKAFFYLETLIYSADYMKDSFSSWDTGKASIPFDLISKPGDPVFSERIRETLSGDVDESVLVRNALLRRPETRAASLAVDVRLKGIDMAKTPLYPTLRVTGNYTYANPNQRVVFQSDPEFTGTWSLGLYISYGIGSIPSKLSELDAKKAELRSSIAGKERQEESIIQDVRGCLVSYIQARRNIELVSRMLEQSTENERVTSQRVKTGMASDLDLLRASLSRLRSEFSIVNKQIDLQIAAADLDRAAVLTESE